LIVRSDHSWGWYTDCPGMFAKQPPIHFRDHPVYRMPVPYVKFFVVSPGTETRFGEEAQGQTLAEVKRRRLKQEAALSRDLLPIKEVRVGPMVQQEETMLACEIMLCEKGYENVPVIASKIPYRGS